MSDREKRKRETSKAWQYLWGTSYQRYWKQKQWLICAIMILLQITVVNRLELRAETVVETENTAVYKREIEHEVVYEEVEGAAEIPDQIEVHVRDGDQETITLCFLKEKQIQEEHWREDFSMPVTIHVWEASVYALGEQQVHLEEDPLVLLNHEAELLAQAGLSMEDYRLTDICWSGGLYTDGEGNRCRDALASGEKLVKTIRAQYTGTAVFDGEPDYIVAQRRPVKTVSQETDLTMHEEEFTETQQGELPEITVLPEAEIKSERIVRTKATLWQRITRMLIWAFSLGAILFFGGLIVLAGLHIAKKIHLWYDQHR